MSKLKKCAFCGGDTKHFRALPKTKHYEVERPDGVEMVSTELSVMQCLSCKTRWIRYFEIDGAIND